MYDGCHNHFWKENKNSFIFNFVDYGLLTKSLGASPLTPLLVCFVVLFSLDHFNWHKYVNCKWNILQIDIYSLSIVIMFMFVGPFLLEAFVYMFVFSLILNNCKSRNGNICRFEVKIMNDNVDS